MKNINKLFIAVLLLIKISSYAQDSNYPWAVGLGLNAVNTNAGAGGYFSEFFNVEDHWNAIPLVSYINLTKHIGNGFSFGITGSINKINKLVQKTNDGIIYVADPGNLTYYGIDGLIKYSFQDLIKSTVIDPSLHLGGGYSGIGSNMNAVTLNGGVGITFWFTQRLGLSLQSSYKKSFKESGLPTHSQNMLGLTFKFGGKDTDGDGVYDRNDECPDIPGLKELNGCPDRDGDGVPDKDDECPDVKGLKEFKGCPDTDGDGVPDKDDKCPDVKGPKENDGCPWPDRDGDGIPDKDDKCPDVKGTVVNNGCPEEEEEVVARKLNDFSKTLLFDTGKVSIEDEDELINTANAIVTIMEKYPDTKYRVEAHTDNTGSRAINIRVSKKRADSVREYLVSKGINPDRLTSTAHGSDKPIADNNTEAGRIQNRRVEVSLVK